ncbi:hypothetical protein P148_SR1C00001G1081 [candidate division SR1 bacterium RAAC1_SR1_1]|nr:hypothetical protein P148_SR1C00001G1081 [candidate division SR1 bacterium RAAC1_SR1_1]
MSENNQLGQQTEKQKESLANTIGTRKGLSLSMGLEELGRAIGVGTKKPEKKHHNEYQISEELEQFDRKQSKKRPPILLN